jgi:Predicted EndoIII-related endonuclease
MAEDRVREIIKCLKKAYPGVRVSLNFSNPMEILVATILSAQCTDAMVNRVTEKLFRRYRTVPQYADAKQKEWSSSFTGAGSIATRRRIS